jgi:hypothetical protein
VGAVDYAAGAVSLPVVNPRYTPTPDHYFRPVARVGYSFSEALRIGVAATRGPYLSDNVNAMLPPGAEWQDYRQTIVAADARLSFDNVVTHAEVAWSSYEVPTMANEVRGLGAFGEVRVAHSPRVFSALRVERFRYPFIRPNSATSWRGVEVTQWNAEAGVGYRISPSAIAKLSYRRDYWPGEVAPASVPAPDGYALAAQLSWLFDVMGMFEKQY